LQLRQKKLKKIIAVSHATKDEIIDHLHVPSNKIVVTYEGVDPLVLKEGTQTKEYGKFFYTLVMSILILFSLRSFFEDQRIHPFMVTTILLLGT